MNGPSLTIAIYFGSGLHGHCRLTLFLFFTTQFSTNLSSNVGYTVC